MKTTKILAIGAALTLLGCTESISTDNWETTDGRITFMPTISDNMILTRALAAQDVKTVRLTDENDAPFYMHSFVQPRVTTRGTLINDVEDDLTTLGRFGVSGYRYAAATQSVQDATANFFYNVEVREALGEWTTNEPYYYPSSSDRLTFYAYSPYTTTFGSTEVTNISGNGETTADYGPMTLTYTVNPTLGSQTDLMVASNETSFNPGKKVPLNFRHALTAIRFQLGTDVAPTWTIKSLGIKQVISTAKYKVGTGWVFDSSTVRDDFTLDFTSTQQPDGKALSDEDKQLMANGQYFLMIPQTFTDDDDRQCIDVVLKNTTTGKERRLVCPLQQTTWTAGTVVNYTISTSSVNLVQATITYPADWGGEAFTLKSSYDDEASVGVYAVDISTKKVVVKNTKLIYNQATDTWNTENDKTLKYNRNYDYYFYYPYNSNISGGHDLDDTFNGSSATDFFSGVISNWTVTEDQSTSAKLLPNDLHIGQAVHDNDNFTHVSVAMQHAMGLAKITLGEKEVGKIVKLYRWEYPIPANPTLLTTEEELTTITASNKFYLHKPVYNNGHYYFVTKSGVNTTFSSTVEVSAPDAWAQSYSATIAGGKSQAVNVALANASIEQVTYKGWRFDYTGGEQTFITPSTGGYLLEVYGAQGGYNGGRGGFSQGEISLDAGSTLYVNVGGQGLGNGSHAYRAGGYNGGGNAVSDGDGNTRQASGGGATHIATASGILSSLSENRNAVLIVAGGGGGTGGNSQLMYSAGGVGGGEEGGAGVRFDCGYYYDRGFGGTQTEGGRYYTNSATTYVNGSFGQGGSRVAAGGGGGWYGGGSGGYCAGGGSGYIGGVTNATTTAGLRIGHGEARIISLVPVSE